MNTEMDHVAPTYEIAPSTTERRRAPRANVVTEINLFSDSNFYAGFTEDISEGGVFVASYAMVPVGVSVELELGLPGGFEIRATGTVRWLRCSGAADDGTEPPGMGIQFDRISDDDRELIREFVRNRSPLFFESSEA